MYKQMVCLASKSKSDKMEKAVRDIQLKGMNLEDKIAFLNGQKEALLDVIFQKWAFGINFHEIYAIFKNMKFSRKFKDA